MSRKKRENPKKPSKFIIFVKPYDEYGVLDEDNCGWLNFDKEGQPKMFLYSKNALHYENKPQGHGSFEDWEKFFKEEHPNWKLVVKYIE